MEVTIKHDRNLVVRDGALRWLRFLVPRNSEFWRTEVSEHGFEIQTWLSRVTIPWEKIECLDLSGLEDKAEFLSKPTGGVTEEILRRLQEHRSFMIMCPERWLLMKACTRSFGKFSIEAANVMRFQNIDLQSAPATLKALKEMAIEKGIHLDQIALGF